MMMAAIRPTQFSALKVLDPLDDEDERAEDDERQRYVQQIPHELSRSSGRASPVPTHIKLLLRARLSGPDSSYAGVARFLTDPMRVVNAAH